MDDGREGESAGGGGVKGGGFDEISTGGGEGDEGGSGGDAAIGAAAAVVAFGENGAVGTDEIEIGIEGGGGELDGDLLAGDTGEGEAGGACIAAEGADAATGGEGAVGGGSEGNGGGGAGDGECLFDDVGGAADLDGAAA